MHRNPPGGALSRLPARLAAGLAAIAVTLLLLEGLVRLLGLQGDSFYRPDRETGWAHRPSVRGRYVSPEARAPVVINAQGLMGPDVETGPDRAGRRRLLLLGDSFTESLQVPWRESWAHHVREALGPEWEVLNAGVAGYGTDNALLWFEHRGRELDPDLVLLTFFTGNDVSDNDRALSLRIGGVERKPYFEIDGGRLALRDFPLSPPAGGFVPAVKRFLSGHSRLYLLVRTTRNRMAGLDRQRRAGGDGVPLPWHVYRTDASPEWERAWRVTAALLAELDRRCRAAGAELRVASIPTGWRIEPEQRRRIEERHPALADGDLWDFDLPDRRLAAILDSLGVPYLSLTDTLEAARDAAGAALYGDHLTAAGHEVAGAAIAAFLKRDLGESAMRGAVQR